MYHYTEEQLQSMKKVEQTRAERLNTLFGRMSAEEKDAVSHRGRANRMLEEAMAKGGIAEKRAIYSAPLMLTQIRLIEQILMEQKYFGE